MRVIIGLSILLSFFVNTYADVSLFLSSVTCYKQLPLFDVLTAVILFNDLAAHSGNPRFRWPAQYWGHDTVVRGAYSVCCSNH